MKQQWIVKIETRFGTPGNESNLKVNRRFMQSLLDRLGLPIKGYRINNGIWAGTKSIKEKR